MGIIVQKFGGSSVADTDKLFKVCNHIIKEYEEGNQIIVVVSAQGKTTDKLISEEKEITLTPSKREHDVLLTTGEQITISKLCLCLEKLGYKAISFTGWQIPIITNSIHGNARIKQINTAKIKEHLAEGKIVVVAGFQGIDENLNITTLGRGGSDTTAVAIAASIKADCCQIYTDVDGIYSSDPRIVRSVSKINTISYDEMLELSSLGAKVLHNRCVEIGSKYNVPIYVKSTFEKDSIGTLLTTKNLIEDLCINGVTKQDDIVRITLIGKDEKIGRIYKVFNLLAANDVNVDIIVQAFGEHITKDISFAIKQEDLELTLEILNENADDLNINDIKYCKNLSKVSLVGIGILNNPKVIAALFEILYENNINMHMITTSETKISILVNQNLGETTLKLIHDKFIQPSI